MNRLLFFKSGEEKIVIDPVFLNSVGRCMLAFMSAVFLRFLERAGNSAWGIKAKKIHPGTKDISGTLSSIRNAKFMDAALSLLLSGKTVAATD